MLEKGGRKMVFTSESVTEGHPDKICDQIADRILDAHLAQDPQARVACEVLIGKGMVVVTGEVTSKATVPIEEIVHQTIREIGYPDTFQVVINVSEQSPDIAKGVDESLESQLGNAKKGEGAGDQGMMFGYACDETEAYLPMPIYYAHQLTKRLAEARKKGDILGLQPDGKAQVTIEYEEVQDLTVAAKKRWVPKCVKAIVISAQHIADKDITQLRKEIQEKVIQAVIPKEQWDKDIQIYINPTGRFVVGGPEGDSGLTGRKIMVDTYGGMARHGGGSFSGKDPTKVDRTAAYMARLAAKSIVASRICSPV